MLITLRIFLASAACLGLAACNSGTSLVGTSVPKKDVAATVNGVAISESLLGIMLKQRTDLGKSVDPEARKIYIDRLAQQLAIVMESEKKGLDKKPEVMAQLELDRQSILVNAFVEDFQKSHPVTDDEIKAEYERIKAEAAGNEYKARHILVDSEADAKAVIVQLNKNPKAFETLAREKSKDGGSKEKGGDLGWFHPKRMVPEFGAAVAKLDKGKFTQEPVKTAFGYHVILLEDSRPGIVAPIDQYQARLKDHLQQQKLQKAFDELKSKAKIEVVQKP